MQDSLVWTMISSVKNDMIDIYLRDRTRSKHIPGEFLTVRSSITISSVHSSINALSVTLLHSWIKPTKKTKAKMNNQSFEEIDFTFVSKSKSFE